MRTIFKLTKKKKGVLIFSLILALFNVLLVIQGPLLLGKITDMLISGVKNNNLNLTLIFRLLTILISCYLLSFILTAFRSFLLSLASIEISYDLRKKVDAKINKLSIATLDKKLDGDILSIVVNDIDTLDSSLRSFLTFVFPSILTLIATIILMAYLSIKLTIVVVLFLPLSILTLKVVVQFSQKHFKERQEKIAKLNAHIEEVFTNQDVITAFNGQEKVSKTFENINDDLFKSTFLSQFLSNMNMPIITVLNNINLILICFYASFLILAGSLSFGAFQSFIQFLNSFHPTLSSISQLMTFYQQITAASNRISNFLNEENMEDESHLKNLDTSKIKGNIEFRDVCFSYNEDKIILDKLNFKVNAGEKVAIIGHTGSGKTTIINLLMKFYDIVSGDILIDGISIKNIKKDDIADIFTMVLQDTWLFKGSIKENIMFGKNEEVSFEEVKEASKKANSHHFIRTLANGYDTTLNEEISNISQGQKQQLTIARAFLKNSKMLILDEATSAIDSRTEKLIQESMKELMKDKTTFIIAHRLSTIKDSDKIILIDKGKIIEMGTHEELMQKNGSYKELYYSK